MACLTTIDLAHLPSPHNTIYVSLFRNVQNGAFLRQQLLDGNTDFEYAFIDASTLVSTNHVLAACFRAVNDLVNTRLRSKNVHSEIVFSLGTNSNIGASLKTFGVDTNTSNLLAIKVSRTIPQTPDQEFDHIREHLMTKVRGEAVAFDDRSLASMTDWTRVTKIYKLLLPDSNARRQGRDGAIDHSGEIDGYSPAKSNAEDSILGLIALRGS